MIFFDFKGHAVNIVQALAFGMQLQFIEIVVAVHICVGVDIIGHTRGFIGDYKFTAHASYLGFKYFHSPTPSN